MRAPDSRIVEPAHMELAEPSIATAFDACVARGATTVVVSPYFLLPGRHWSQDIPALVEQAAARHPGVRFLVAAPFGLHPMMAEVVGARVAHCLAHPRRGGRVRGLRRHRHLPCAGRVGGLRPHRLSLSARYRSETARSSRKGSIAPPPPGCISKCRCGMVRRASPVLPITPSRRPTATRVPGARPGAIEVRCA